MSFYETFHTYSLFSSKDEMDLHIAKHKKVHRFKLNDTDYKVLLHIQRFSCRYQGVCCQKLDTMVSYLQVSDRTIKRSLKKLEDLHIIKRITRRTKNGHFAPSIIQIQPFVPSSVLRKASHRKMSKNPCASKVQKLDIQSKPICLLKLNFQSINTTAEQSAITDNKESKPSLYQQLKDLYHQRLRGKAEFRELVKVVFGSLKKYKQETKITHSDLEQVMMDAFHTLTTYPKPIRNFAAFLSTLIRNKVNDILNIATYRKVETIPEWFEHRHQAPKQEEQNPNFEQERIKVFRLIYGDDYEQNPQWQQMYAT